jgi:hypothetical protein
MLRLSTLENQPSISKIEAVLFEIFCRFDSSHSNITLYIQFAYTCQGGLRVANIYPKMGSLNDCAVGYPIQAKPVHHVTGIACDNSET